MLYEISDKYINFVRLNYDSRVLDNHFVSHNRKYIGLKIDLDNYSYFLPLSSPDRSDYSPDGKVRKTIVPIYRMFQNNGNFLGKILLNNMLPAPPSELTLYDVSSETDYKYKMLVLAELRIINRDYAKIEKNAITLYHQRTLLYGQNKNYPNYLNSTVDFKLLEAAYNDFISRP